MPKGIIQVSYQSLKEILLLPENYAIVGFQPDANFRPEAIGIIVESPEIPARQDNGLPVVTPHYGLEDISEYRLILKRIDQEQLQQQTTE